MLRSATELTCDAPNSYTNVIPNPLQSQVVSVIVLHILAHP
jgi:hypothetical protein